MGQRDFYCLRWANKHIQHPKSGRYDRATRVICTYYGLYRICFFLFNTSPSHTLQLLLNFRASSNIYFIQLLKLNQLFELLQLQVPLSRAHPFLRTNVAGIDVNCFLSSHPENQVRPKSKIRSWNKLHTEPLPASSARKKQQQVLFVYCLY